MITLHEVYYIGKVTTQDLMAFLATITMQKVQSNRLFQNAGQHYNTYLGP